MIPANYYRIMATQDTIGEDREYLSDCLSENVCDEIADTLEDCVSRLHQLVDSCKTNSIEVIYPDPPHGNHHVSFHAPDHPFVAVAYSFDEIDVWADTQRVCNITPQTQCSIVMDDGTELPF